MMSAHLNVSGRVQQELLHTVTAEILFYGSITDSNPTGGWSSALLNEEEEEEEEEEETGNRNAA